MKLALVHYSYAPVIGGVEAVMSRHAAMFLNLGHEVTVVCGAGAPDRAGIGVNALPELNSENPLVREAAGEIRCGSPGGAFDSLVRQLASGLHSLMQSQAIVFVHNVLHMPFQLALTAALWRLAAELRDPRFISWIHDLAADNPDYCFPKLDQWPWRLLALRHPNFEYVAVSEQRRVQFSRLTGAGSCTVIPNLIDPVEFLGLTQPVAAFARDHGILEHDLVLLQPARLLARKNIELTIEVAAAFKARGVRMCCLVTAPPDAQRPDSNGYAQGLRDRIAQLGLATEVLLLNDLFTVTTPDLISLYQLGDALFFPGKQEGFGLPLFEAALHRMPVFCADIEPMKSLIGENATRFDPDGDASVIAGVILKELRRTATFRARKESVQRYSVSAVSSVHLEPLLAEKR